MIVRSQRVGKRTNINGWFFIPTSMFFAAITWGTAQNIPLILLKSMDVPNALIGFASLLGLPIGFRFLLGPFVDKRGTKRTWLMHTQPVVVGIMLSLAAFCGISVLFNFSSASWFLLVLVFLFALLSFASAFNDLSWGGFFLASVDERDKALFSGINASFVRIANIFSQGFMVMLTGRIQEQTGQAMAGWAVCFSVFGILQLFLSIYHRFIYPYPVLDKPLTVTEQMSFLRVFRCFLGQPRAWVILAFVFLYRVDQGLLTFMKVPFMMDSPEVGGMGASLEQVGLINGAYAAVAMICGGVLGGLMVRKLGLRRVIWPFAFLLTIPNLGFVWLAAHPIYTEVHFLGTTMNPWLLGTAVFESFGYGIGFSSFAFFQCEVSRGPYRATFFALMTGVMLISWVTMGSISGLIQSQVGYFWLFALSVVSSIPGIAIIAWLPLRELEEKGKQEDASRHAAEN